MPQISSRLARGIAVVLAIVLAHFIIAWLFAGMRVPAPDLGPFFPAFLDDPRKAGEAPPSDENAGDENDGTPRAGHAGEDTGAASADDENPDGAISTR